MSKSKFSKHLIYFAHFALSCCIQGKINCSEFFLKIKQAEAKSIDLSTYQQESHAHIIKNEQTIYNEILIAPSGLQTPITFYDRNSDIVLLAGQGLPAPKEVMDVYAQLFDKYDVILFDYRWNKKYASFLINALLNRCPVQKILLDELEEVYTVLNFAKNKKKYKKIIGLGECYSNFLFAKLQADEIKTNGTGPFTHLVLDSCWHSLKSFTEQICFDPFLPISPQVGGAPWLLKTLTNNKIFKWLALKVIFALMQDISIERHLALLNIPVLFIHGLSDLFVPQPHFQKICTAMNPEFRVIFLTPYHHCDNVKNKKIYRFISDQFINAKSIKDFEENIFHN